VRGRLHTTLSRANEGVARVDLRERGLRMPTHTWLCEADPRELRPLFAAPLRPNETLVGLRLRADVMTQQMMKVAWFNPVEVELAVWKVPISVLGEEFMKLMVADAEDSVGSFSTVAGSGVPVGNPSTAVQGATTPQAHQARVRPWAGEIGQAGALPTDNESLYTPYVSESMYRVATSYYEVEQSGDPTQAGLQGGTTTTLSGSVDLYEHPPVIGPHIRGATLSGIAIGGTPGSQDTEEFSPFFDSISQWAERLSLMSKPNQTYAEWLGSFGVNASRIATLPEPVMIQRKLFQRIGTPQGWMENVGTTTASDFIDSHGQALFTAIDTATTDFRVWRDTAGSALMGASFDVTRGRRLMIDEPSILLGTWVYWLWHNSEGEYTHMFDLTRMTHGSHWGNPTGGIDESDFLTVQRLFTQDGATLQTSEETGAVGPLAMNMLNLYLHGDSFSNTNENFNWFHPGRGSYDRVDAALAQDVAVKDRRINCIGHVQLAVASDLVGR